MNNKYNRNKTEHLKIILSACKDSLLHFIALKEPNVYIWYMFKINLEYCNYLNNYFINFHKRSKVNARWILKYQRKSSYSTKKSLIKKCLTPTRAFSCRQWQTISWLISIIFQTRWGYLKFWRAYLPWFKSSLKNFSLSRKESFSE